MIFSFTGLKTAPALRNNGADRTGGLGAWARSMITIGFCLLAFALAGNAMAQSGLAPEPAKQSPVGGNVPGEALGSTSDSELWRNIRSSGVGTVAIRDKMGARLIQSAGEDWRNWRTGPLITYSAWALLGMVGLLALFFGLRGRIRIDSGVSGQTIRRFNMTERVSHWLVALSFITLGLTGINLLFGRSLFIPLIGKDAFAAMAATGKLLHNTVAFAFMLGLALIFFHWVLHNFPNRHDVVWLLKGGGFFSKSHPPARKFNAGQKIFFWLVLLSGVVLSLSGWALLFPYTTSFFADSFAFFNTWFGTSLPTELTQIQEQQYASLLHAGVAVFLAVVILAHIYIGSIGMEGAIGAMTTGDVDVNWAKEHHSVWVEEEMALQPAPPPAKSMQTGDTS
ncbi:Formate dehydrogenase -O, gamma subunit [hydrothermal vent metagenome]|uniref:Formate dehydrogenase -O, gamma subunit n=1 Tax=hydrothermal vent metagenome TaxID=652676 RepID=A0A3B0T4M0_9ZZZZ